MLLLCVNIKCICFLSTAAIHSENIKLTERSGKLWQLVHFFNVWQCKTARFSYLLLHSVCGDTLFWLKCVKKTQLQTDLQLEKWGCHGLPERWPLRVLALYFRTAALKIKMSELNTKDLLPCQDTEQTDAHYIVWENVTSKLHCIYWYISLRNVFQNNIYHSEYIYI